MLTPNASCTLYLQTGPGAYTRVYVPACFWQDGEDGVSIVIPGELPEQYKGEKREKDYVVQGERMGEVTDTQSNCNFTEELQDWVQQQNRKGVPLSGDGLSFVSISASNGAFTDWDENFQYGVYKIQGTLIYEKE